MMGKEINEVEPNEQKTEQIEEIEAPQIDLVKGKKLIGYAAIIQIGYLLLTNIYFLITTSKFSVNNTVVLAVVIVLYMLIFFKGNKIACAIVGFINGIICILAFYAISKMISFLFSPAAAWFGGYMLESIFIALIQLVVCGGIIILYAKSKNVREYIADRRK